METKIEKIIGYAFLLSGLALIVLTIIQYQTYV